MVCAVAFVCAGGVIHSIGDSQDIHFICGLSVYMPFTSSSLMVSNFAVCGMAFLAGFYSRDFILEMFSVRYVNIFGFFINFFDRFNSLLFFPSILFGFMW